MTPAHRFIRKRIDIYRASKGLPIVGPAWEPFQDAMLNIIFVIPLIPLAIFYLSK